MSQWIVDEEPLGCFPPVLNIEEAFDQESRLFEKVLKQKRYAGFMIWKTFPSIVVPSRFTSICQYEFASESMAREGWRVVERNTGGDVVPQTPGVMNLTTSFLMPKEYTGADRMDYAYELLTRPIVKALKKLGLKDVEIGSVPGAFCDGRYNVTIAGRKVAGTAQRWRWCEKDGEKRAVVLAHAALIADGNIELMVEAVNRFCSFCGIDKSFEPDSHTSVLGSLGPAEEDSGDDLPSELSSLLERYYRTEMSAVIRQNRA